jgi:hypothetical protein
MGYDMYLERRVVPKEVLVEDAPDENYFRLNIWGMARFGEQMDRLGMIDPLASQTILFTENDDEAANERVLTQCAAKPIGIPGYKLSSNDGWLVLPEEIRAALVAYRALPAPESAIRGQVDLDYWRSWIAFLERAAERGGFRVW